MVIRPSARLGIVIAALEVVEARLGIVVISSVADGVALCHRAGPFNGIAPGVVGVAGHDGLIPGANDLFHVSLLVLDKDILRLCRRTCPVIFYPIHEADHFAYGVVVEVEAVFRTDLCHQPTAVPDVLFGHRRAVVHVSHGFLRPEPAVIVGKGQDVVPPGHALQLSAPLPLHGTAHVVGGVAYPVIGDA